MPNDTIVDIYCHIIPEKFFQEMNRIAPRLGNIAARLRGVKKLFDLDERFREMDQFGEYRQIVSLPNPPIEDLAVGTVGLDLARIGNDAMAELCARHPKRFPTFVAAVSMTDVEGSVAEARRAVKDLGAGGIQIFTSVAGRPLDEAAFEPIFATMAELDLPIWLHPARTASMPDYPAEQKSRYEMWWCFGWPYDTSVAMVRMVFCGLLDRYPKLKIITHHLGGMIPYYDGRIGPGLQVLGSRTSDEDYSKVLPSLKRPHLGLSARFLRRYRAVRRRHPGGALRTRVLRLGSRGVRDRHAAGTDRADDRYDQATRHRGGGPAQDIRRKCRDAVEEKAVLNGRQAMPMKLRCFAAAAMLLLAAGGGMLVPPATAAEKLRVGKAVPEAFSFVPLDIGIRKGFFAKNGLEIESIAFAGDARMQQAMASDSLDIALGSGPAMAFIVKGAPIKAVAAMAGPPLLLAIVVRPDGPKTAADLKGKKISVSTAGSLTYWLVSETSRRQGWGPKGIDIAPMGAMPGQIAAMKRGDIDGAIMDIGNAFELEKRGEGRILVRFIDIKDFHIHVIFATDKLIADRPEALRGFLKGWFETIAFMRKNKAETVAIAKEVTNKDEAITSRVYDELMPMFSDDGKFNPGALITLAKSYVELQLLPEEPDMKKLYSEAFLPK